MTLFETQDNCCEADTAAPTGADNRPGLAQIRYRIGTHSQFKDRMLRALSASAALSRLSTRDADDASIALIDSWATVLDVLTFYQERIANEGFLLPAGERRSVLELARAIGYELNPGVTAETHLAFSVEQVPGADAQIELSPGLKVQSIPGQDETPQIFETVEALSALPEFNQLRPRLGRPHSFARSSTRVYLQGVDSGLQPGDLILLAGRSRESNPLSERWDVRTLTEVSIDSAANHTLLRWAEDLGHTDPWVDPAEAPRLYAFRQRASLFGYNAPDWRLMPENIKQIFDPDGRQIKHWPDFEIQTVAERRIDLDSVYDSVVNGSWVLLDKPGYRELYRAVEVFTDSRTDFSLTTKTTSLVLDANRHLSWFPLRDTSVFTASEDLPLADNPIALPVFGDRIELDSAFDQLQPGRRLIFQGLPLTQVTVAERVRSHRSADRVHSVELPPLLLLPDNGGAPLELVSGEVLTLLAPPEPTAAAQLCWSLLTDSGVSGKVIATEEDLIFLEDEAAAEPAFAPPDTGAEVAEVATLRAIEGDEHYTVLVLEAPLRHIYRRRSLRINANVVAATHGETGAEILAQLTGSAAGEAIGSGNNASAMQQFTLAQTPLTYTPAASASGGESSLQIRVDGIAWTEVPSLYGQPGDARVYTTRQNHKQQTRVIFGDGNFGARLPTGRDNISASYRIGTGMPGLVRREQLQLLMTRPLGVKSVTNPLAASGAQDPEDLHAARANAPLTVLTLERIVSAQDFEDFARAFAGIGKAQATVLWNGERQIVHLTVGGADAQPIAADAALLSNLRAAIDAARHPDQQISIDSYSETLFGLSMDLVVNTAYQADLVVAAVRDKLLDQYRFANRAFAQSVSAAEVTALAQAVEGIEAVVLTSLDGSDPLQHPTLPAPPAHWDNTAANIVPAALLLIDADAITLETRAP